jgi:hypothetical protein
LHSIRATEPQWNEDAPQTMTRYLILLFFWLQALPALAALDPGWW